MWELALVVVSVTESAVASEAASAVAWDSTSGRPLGLMSVSAREKELAKNSDPVKGVESEGAKAQATVVEKGVEKGLMKA